jgi:4'-phosphopantetheinyl transferase
MKIDTVIIYTYISDNEKYLIERANEFLEFQSNSRESFLGRKLIFEGLKILGINNLSYKQIEYSKLGKPYFKTTDSTLDFNISHSGDIVICVVSNSCKVGIDIEKVKPIEIYNFKDHFSKNEWDSLEETTNPLDLFYSYWTQKEAILKANGYGISVPLLKIEAISKSISFEGQSWYAEHLKLDILYKSCLISKKPVHYLIKQINF